MLILFPMNFNLKRNTVLPKLIIRIGGKISGTEGLAINKCYSFAKIAKRFKGKPLTQTLIFELQQGEVFAIGIQLKFKTRRQMNRFVKYVLSNPNMRES